MPCAIVLGMHRSGTSALAGTLHHLGVNMGSRLLVGNRETNPKGHFEDTELVMLNEVAIGGDWRNPRQVHSPIVRQRFETYVAQRAGTGEEKLWGVKDPRLCFTFRMFRHALQTNLVAPMLVVNHRSREAVASSLKARGSLRNVPAEVIFDRYQAAIEDVCGSFDGPTLHVDYDELVEDPNLVAQRLSMFLGIDDGSPEYWEGIQAAERFIAPELRHWPEEETTT